MVVAVPIPPDPRVKRRQQRISAPAPQIPAPIAFDETEAYFDVIVETPPAEGRFDDDAEVEADRRAYASTFDWLDDEGIHADNARQDLLHAGDEWAALALAPDVFDATPWSRENLAAELEQLEDAIDDGCGSPAMEDRAFVLRRRLGGAR